MNNYVKVLVVSGVTLVLLGVSLLLTSPKEFLYSKNQILCIQTVENSTKFTIQVLASFNYHKKPGYVVEILSPLEDASLQLVPETFLTNSEVSCR